MSQNRISLAPSILRRNGFISLVVKASYMEEEVLTQAKKLAQAGERVVVVDPSWAGSEARVLTCPSAPNLIKLSATDQHIAGLTWDKLVQVVASSMNENREAYNKKLAYLWKVEHFKINYSPIYLATTKIEKRLLVLHFTPTSSGGKQLGTFELLSYKQGDQYFECLPFVSKGDITRWTNNKKFAWGVVKPQIADGVGPRTIYLMFTLSPPDSKPLSMLTPQNVFLEKVVKPQPIRQEPTIR